MAQAPVTDDQLELERLGEEVRASSARLRNAARAHNKALARYAAFLNERGIVLTLVDEDNPSESTGD